MATLGSPSRSLSHCLGFVAALAVPLFVFAGHDERYHEVCQQFLDRWTEWTGNDLACVAGLCTLDRMPPEDLVSLKGLIERAIEAFPDRRAELMSRVAIRRRKYQQAIDYLISDPSSNRDPICQVTLAIAHHHANHPDEARAALDRVPRAFAEVQSPDGFPCAPARGGIADSDRHTPAGR